MIVWELFLTGQLYYMFTIISRRSRKWYNYSVLQHRLLFVKHIASNVLNKWYNKNGRSAQFLAGYASFWLESANNYWTPGRRPMFWFSIQKTFQTATTSLLTPRYWRKQSQVSLDFKILTKQKKMSQHMDRFFRLPNVHQNVSQKWPMKQLFVTQFLGAPHFCQEMSLALDCALVRTHMAIRL